MKSLLSIVLISMLAVGTSLYGVDKKDEQPASTKVSDKAEKGAKTSQAATGPIDHTRATVSTTAPVAPAPLYRGLPAVSPTAIVSTVDKKSEQKTFDKAGKVAATTAVPTTATVTSEEPEGELSLTSISDEEESAQKPEAKDASKTADKSVVKAPDKAAGKAADKPDAKVADKTVAPVKK
jgi:hypothetical protein